MKSPHNIPKDRPVWEYIPQFQKKLELHAINPLDWEDEDVEPSEADIDKMVRFVMFMCSPMSDHFTETDMPTRLKACMKDAGIHPNDTLGQMINDHHWWYVRVIVTFMMLYASTDFSRWVASKVMLGTMLEVMMAPPSADEKADRKAFVKAKNDAFDSVKELISEVNDIERDLFPVEGMADMVFRQQMFDMKDTAEAYALTWEGYDSV